MCFSLQRNMGLMSIKSYLQTNSSHDGLVCGCCPYHERDRQMVFANATSTILHSLKSTLQDKRRLKQMSTNPKIEGNGVDRWSNKLIVWICKFSLAMYSGESEWAEKKERPPVSFVRETIEAYNRFSSDMVTECRFQLEAPLYCVLRTKIEESWYSSKHRY